MANPDVKLKDGTKSSGKKVLIDGQQRITAMAAAIVGQEVLDDHYKWKRISIAFNPVEEKFEVANNAIEDNYFDLLPGTERILRFEDPSGQEPQARGLHWTSRNPKEENT